MKKLPVIAALAVVAILMTPPARADNFAYMTVNGGDFGTIDLKTGAFSKLGNSGQSLAGFGVANGILYATSIHTAAGTVYTVNPADGSLTAIADSSVNIDIFGSTTSGLYAVGLDTNLYAINPGNGVATLIGPTGLSFGTWRTLSTNAATLYFANGTNLYTLNTATGAATLIGDMGGPQLGSILLEGGVLYGGEETPTLEVDTLNSTTGKATAGSAVSGTSSPFYALAPKPLPTSDYDVTVENTQNLLGYWRFSTTSQANSEVNGYTGTFMGAAAVGAARSGPGVIGDQSNTAAVLDGTSGFVPTSLSGQIDQQGSIVGWFYLMQLPSDAGHHFVIADASNFGNDFGVGVETDNFLKFYTDSGGHVTAPVAFTAADLNTWHFFAATFTAGTTRNLYLDGALVDSDVPGSHSLNTGDTFAIGESIAFPGRFFGGRLDEIAVFDRELSAAEVANIYAVAAPRQLLNISTRLKVLTNDNVLIGGFIITGTNPKKVILRAIGPSLADANPPVAGALADTVLELHEPDRTVITNDNWKDTQKDEIIATTIPPTDDLESAIVETLDPGAYTAVVRGNNGATGIGLVEAYDLDQTADSELANISTRGFVDAGDNVMIGGFIVGGEGGRNVSVIVRAIGPSLAKANPPVPGALADPTLELHDSNGTTLTSNDNWRDTQEAEIIASTVPPTDDLESAIVMTLAPGAYTAVVSGKNNTTGVALVEAYNLP